MDTEYWKVVRGYRGRYSVSSLGNVRNSESGRLLKPCVAGKGYLSVKLSINGNVRRWYIHRLVLESFVGPQAGAQANHLDGIKANNQLGNLEWCTHAENMAHAAKSGLMVSGDAHRWRKHPEIVPRGARHWMHLHPERIPRGEDRSWQTHLTSADVLEIRRLASAGELHRDIAERFGLQRGSVSQIVTRKRWGHL